MFSTFSIRILNLLILILKNLQSYYSIPAIYGPSSDVFLSLQTFSPFSMPCNFFVKINLYWN